MNLEGDFLVVDDYIAAGQSTRIMMRQIKDLPRLSQKEETKLAKKAKNGNREARNRLAVSLLHRSTKLAGRYYGHDFDDLVQDGAEALLNNVANTHPARLNLPIRRKMTEDVALMYKPFSIPYHLISVLGCLTRIWERKTQELKRLPCEEELVDDLKTAIKRRGNFRVDEEVVALLLKLLDLPLSLDEVEKTVSVRQTLVNDTKPVIKKLQEVFADSESREDFEAAQLTLGINGGKKLNQRQAAKALKVSQRTVCNRVSRFKKQLANDSRIYTMYQELKDLREEEFY